MADAISSETGVGIAFVGAKGEILFFEIRENVSFWCEKEGADNHPFSRAHRAESAESRTTEEAQKKGFRLIVSGVGDGDGDKPQFFSLFFEEFVANGTEA